MASTQQSRQRRAGWWALQRWQQVLLVGLVVIVLVLSAALIFFQPGNNIVSDTHTGPAATAASLYAPGSRWFYRRSQWDQPESSQQP